MASIYDSQWQSRQVPRSPAAPRGRRQAEGQADLLRLLGGLAPAVGGVGGAALGGLVGGLATGGVGIIPGAVAGGGLGASVGSGVGALANYGADMAVRPHEEAAMKKKARDEELMRLLSAMR
ncbi:MAG: hypothetical protein IT459_23820 [Planctomycetes bacterium]|nr:hypothetical protein [Planctomycetota bacterium]